MSALTVRARELAEQHRKSEVERTLTALVDEVERLEAENARVTEINLEMFGKLVDALNERDRLAIENKQLRMTMDYDLDDAMTQALIMGRVGVADQNTER